MRGGGGGNGVVEGVKVRGLRRGGRGVVVRFWKAVFLVSFRRSGYMGL